MNQPDVTLTFTQEGFARLFITLSGALFILVLVAIHQLREIMNPKRKNPWDK